MVTQSSAVIGSGNTPQSIGALWASSIHRFWVVGIAVSGYL